MRNNFGEQVAEINPVVKIQDDPKNNSLRDISIWLDSYDDIFSDFDPRAFSERNISDDFIYELKKVCRENKSPINELKLLIPDKIRSVENENLIIKRLHTHLKKNFKDLLETIKMRRRNGFIFILMGVLLMVSASYISLLKSENFITHTLLVILEPAGWFMLWTGLDDLIKSKRSQKTELDLFVKMAKSKILFVSN